MKEIHRIKGEKHCGANHWKNVSLVVERITEKEAQKIIRTSKLLCNALTILSTLIVPVLITLFMFALEIDKGKTMFQTMVVDGLEGEWFLFFFMFIVCMVPGGIIGYNLVIKPLFNVPIRLLKRHATTVYMGHDSYYKLIKVCKNDCFKKYDVFPLIPDKESTLNPILVDYLSSIFDWGDDQW